MKSLRQIYNPTSAFGNKELIKRIEPKRIIMVNCVECGKIKPVVLRKSFTRTATELEWSQFMRTGAKWCEDCY